MLRLDAEALYAELRRGVQELLRASPEPRALVGIARGGAWLAERLQRDLALPGAHGVITSTLHRDDFSDRGLAGAGQATTLPFAIDGCHVVLVDDVLYTGRTIRAVVNELFDFGRPASVTLAVLVDRGGRELPVAAAFAAARLTLPATQRLRLARADGDDDNGRSGDVGDNGRGSVGGTPAAPVAADDRAAAAPSRFSFSVRETA